MSERTLLMRYLATTTVGFGGGLAIGSGAGLLVGGPDGWLYSLVATGAAMLLGAQTAVAVLTAS